MSVRLYVDGSYEGIFGGAEEAEERAEEVAGDVDPHGHVAWVDWWIVEVDTDQIVAEGTIRVDPPAPPCSGPRHWWYEVTRAPEYEVCIRCGAVRRITTDARRPSTGQRVEDLVEYPDFAAQPDGEHVARAAEETVRDQLVEHLDELCADGRYALDETDEDALAQLAEDALTSEGVSVYEMGAAAADWAEAREGDE